ncbi:MAG: hypothetical protein JO316_00215 [Abitibacteriaceae bacterium]|nr:hypothetical protein [Abditibacteriaceae bacterium]MBV9863749.1 hypothetical protein [Abditibacteriaceae bacterium]
MAGFGNNKPAKNWVGTMWGFLGGLVVGVGAGVGGPKIMHRLSKPDTASKKTKPVVAKPRPTAGPTLDLSPEPAQRGILLSSASPIKLLKPSESKRTQQQADGVFTGFKNWTGTAAYLKSGQGGLFLKATGGTAVSTGWQEGDYDKFVRGIPLHANLTSGQPYTLYFQRKGQRPIDLGTFNIGTATAAPKPATKAPVNVTTKAPATATH